MAALSLTWEMLDECQDPDQIAVLLEEAGIKGRPGNPHQDPMAIATGWFVGRSLRYKNDNTKSVTLTLAEQSFVEAFDDFQYEHLIEE